MKMKSILMISLLASALVLAGCKNTESTVKSSELDSVVTSEEESSSEAPVEDRWEVVDKTAFVTAMAASQTKTAPYTKCVASGYVNGDKDYGFNYMEFTKNAKGKFVTTDTSDTATMVTALVNTRITDFDYEHMGDGGSYIEPILEVSLFGKMRVTCIDNEAITTVAFDEYGYFIYLGGGNVDEPTRGAEVIIIWE